MGAFGRLLEARFGGTKHDVKTWSNSGKKDKQIVICDECRKSVVKTIYIPILKKCMCNDCIEKHPEFGDNE